MHNGRETTGADRKMTDNQQQQRQQQPQPPQKCPRCDSLNTKFCYYNNYSLNQPRYFCKTCKRYWTHGGNLRNVPVGGGCRTAKRSKTCSSGEESSKAFQPPQSLPTTAISSINSGGGFFTNFNQSGAIGGDFAGSSNLGMLEFSVSNLGTQNYHQQIQPTQFYQMGNRDLYQSDESLIPNSSEASLWSISNGSTSTNGGNTSTNQWLNLPGNGPQL